MRKRIIALSLTMAMCFSLSVTAFAMETSLYPEGTELTYDEITEAPEFLKDGDFSNGEILNGAVTYIRPETVEIPFNSSTSRATLDRTISFQGSAIPTINSITPLSNYISLNVGYFNVYHISDGPNRPTNDYDNVRYRILLRTRLGSTVENVYSTLGDSFQKIFWDLDPEKRYVMEFYVVDSLPSQYIAASEVLVSNIAE